MRWKTQLTYNPFSASSAHNLCKRRRDAEKRQDALTRAIKELDNLIRGVFLNC
jgi:hypothetical protein